MYKEFYILKTTKILKKTAQTGQIVHCDKTLGDQERNSEVFRIQV